MIIKRSLQGSNSVTFCDVNCPKCNRIAKLLDYHIENRELLECPVCGFENLLDRETNETSSRNGFGVLYAEFLNKPFLYFVFDEPISETEKETFLNIFNDPFLVKEKSYFYLYKPESNEILVLQGAIPKTFDELIEEEQQKMKYESMLRSYQYKALDGDYEPFGCE